MYEQQYKPSLELNSTINHPLEQIRVIGFLCRDTRYGRHGAALKKEEVPQKMVWDEETGEEFLSVAVPDVALNKIDDGASLYLFDDESVWAASVDRVGNGVVRTFDTGYGEVEFVSAPLHEFEQYDRSEVPIA